MPGAPKAERDLVESSCPRLAVRRTATRSLSSGRPLRAGPVGSPVSRASTPQIRSKRKTWMAGTCPAMTSVWFCLNSPCSSLLDVQRLGAGRIARGIERDFLHPRFRLPQQILAAALERFAALVDGD